MSELLNDILNDIRRRIEKPWDFIPRIDGTIPEEEALWQAKAVCALFETAEPDELLKPLDIRGELVAAGGLLREEANNALEADAAAWDATGERDAAAQAAADRLGFLANVVQSVSEIMDSPASIISALIRDRDAWQQRCGRAEQSLALTEAALHLSQESNVSLAQGQSDLIGLLERVAQFGSGNMNSGAQWITLMDAITAKLNQVTAVGQDERGRLVVQHAPPIPDDRRNEADGSIDV